MNKKIQNIFFVGIGLILIVFVMLFIDSISSNTNGKNDVIPNDVDVFDKDTVNNLYKNKVKAYNDLDQEREKEKIKDGVNVDLGKIFSSNGTSNEVSIQPEAIEKDEQVKIEKPTETAYKPKPQKRSNVFESTLKKAQEEVRKDLSQVTQNDQVSDFGVYSAKKKNTEQATQGKSIEQSEYYPAYFEEDTKIKNNSPVVLILRSNALFEGITVNKNATLYGYASDAGTYFDITITSIKNTDGKTYRVNNLAVYNEKYGRGIAYEGKVDKSVKESADETVNDVGANMPVSSSATEQIGVNVATRAVSRTIQNLSKERQPEISIRQGYKIFVKSE